MTQTVREEEQPETNPWIEDNCRRVLRGWVFEKYHSVADFARAKCGDRNDWVANRLNGRTRLTVDDAAELAERLGYDLSVLIDRALTIRRYGELSGDSGILSLVPDSRDLTLFDDPFVELPRTALTLVSR